MYRGVSSHAYGVVRDHLPPEYQDAIDARIRTAYNMADYDKAKESLDLTVRYLERLNPSAAASLREGLEEIPMLRSWDVNEKSIMGKRNWVFSSLWSERSQVGQPFEITVVLEFKLIDPCTTRQAKAVENLNVY